MLIRTNSHTSATIRDALAREIAGGRIAPTVYVDTLTEHRSRTHARAFSVILASPTKVDGDGRRFGQRGAYSRGDAYAATFDEWGWFLSALFRADDALSAGPYESREAFNEETGWTFDPWRLAREIARPAPYGGDLAPYIKKSALRRRAGRQGYGRAADFPTWDEGRWQYQPRTLADVLELSHLAPEDLGISEDRSTPLEEGERVRALFDGRAGTVYTPEAGGFVRVLFDGDREDSLVDRGRLERVRAEAAR
jgi:hypothetical protein